MDREQEKLGNLLPKTGFQQTISNNLTMSKLIFFTLNVKAIDFAKLFLFRKPEKSRMKHENNVQQTYWVDQTVYASFFEPSITRLRCKPSITEMNGQIGCSGLLCRVLLGSIPHPGKCIWWTYAVQPYSIQYHILLYYLHSSSTNQSDQKKKKKKQYKSIKCRQKMES